jgi:hypothetical protein
MPRFIAQLFVAEFFFYEPIIALSGGNVVLPDNGPMFKEMCV